MIQKDTYGIRQFLQDYPGMSIRPSRDDSLVLKGEFSFSATPEGGGIEITDYYHLEIIIPALYPRVIPRILETDYKIPRDGKHHVNSDNSLCLGSPLRLLKHICQNQNLVVFAEDCLVPYLYAVSNMRQNGGGFVFNELPHGNEGVILDYLELFGLQKPEQVIQALKLLGMKRRIANKKLCPCGCWERLGKCPFHNKMNDYRKIASRSWFRTHAQEIDAWIHSLQRGKRA